MNRSQIEELFEVVRGGDAGFLGKSLKRHLPHGRTLNDRDEVSERNNPEMRRVLCCAFSYIFLLMMYCVCCCRMGTQRSSWRLVGVIQILLRCYSRREQT